MTDRVRRIREHYEPLVHPEWESFRILDWSSREAQVARFRVLAEVLQAPALRAVRVGSAPLSLLDVGCGLTDLCTYLEERAVAARYFGVDITPGILREAHRRWPGRRLFRADMFTAAPFRPRTFDVAYCSGIFNLDLGNNRQFVRAALPRLMASVRGCVVANFLHSRARCPYAQCFYFEPEEICGYVEGKASGVELIDDYLENDFTVVIWP